MRRFIDIVESSREPSRSGQYIVYHGTDAEFEAFSNTQLGSANGRAPINMVGFNFTDNIDLAKSFGRRVIRAKITLNNPYVIDARGENYSEFKHELNDLLDNMTENHDGVIILNYADGGKYTDEYITGNHYIVRNPSNITILEIAETA